jgi:hypothetical protein
MKLTKTPQQLPVHIDERARAPKRAMRIRTHVRAGGGQDDGWATSFDIATGG